MSTNTYLAVFTGSKTSPRRQAWDALTDDQRRAKEKEGIAAWGAWMQKHAAVLVEGGGPLGKTKRVSADGIADVSNDIGAFVMGELKRPERDMPRALLLGVFGVVVLYVSVNVVCVRALGPAGLAATTTPASAVMRLALGERGATVLALGIATWLHSRTALTETGLPDQFHAFGALKTIGVSEEIFLDDERDAAAAS